LGASHFVYERRNGGVGIRNTSSRAGNVLLVPDARVATQLGEIEGVFLVLKLAAGHIEAPLRATEIVLTDGNEPRRVSGATKTRSQRVSQAGF
jgi:hypothetical protein